MSIWAGTDGELDDVPVADVRRFEKEFLDALEREHPGVLASIRDSGDLNDDSVTAVEVGHRRLQEGLHHRRRHAART